MQALPFFTLFSTHVNTSNLPAEFTNTYSYTPHPLCLIAVNALQNYLLHQTDFKHNFGLNNNNELMPVVGKMFGVLVVKNTHNQVGYLWAFSGKLGGTNTHINFVPPVYDMLAHNGFVNDGMVQLSMLSSQINKLTATNCKAEDINALKQMRARKSQALQQRLFESYTFLNIAGVSKTLLQVFKDYNNTKPPSAAGECAAPKLLQYAFKNNLTPVAMAEFWWGKSSVIEQKQHKQYYPACTAKCAPILAHMLS
jgi:tRNA pseudouridine32 synthase / 23S rRNA pseudouridine746 synthase